MEKRIQKLNVTQRKTGKYIEKGKMLFLVKIESINLELGHCEIYKNGKHILIIKNKRNKVNSGSFLACYRLFSSNFSVKATNFRWKIIQFLWKDFSKNMNLQPKWRFEVISTSKQLLAFWHRKSAIFIRNSKLSVGNLLRIVVEKVWTFRYFLSRNFFRDWWSLKTIILFVIQFLCRLKTVPTFENLIFKVTLRRFF